MLLSMCILRKFGTLVISVFSISVKKNLSIQASRDFKSGLDIIDHYQIAPLKYFCPNTPSLSAICDNLKLKVLKVAESKNGHHFY